jgi:DNA phosphorothioation-dependent restriction protein DptG
MKSVTGKKVRHCGTCSSCILRRQSLAAAGIPDETRYAIHEPGYDLSDSQVTGVKAVLSQMRLFRSCIESADARSALFDAFPDLVEASLYLDGQESDIVEMYRRHVDEWFSSNLHHEYKDLVNRRIAA